MNEPKPHDCNAHAIHGALSRAHHHGVEVQECMSCGRWRHVAAGVTEWQPAETLQKYIREQRGITSVWIVLRHSGRATGKERVVFAGEEAKAREEFRNIATALRQGRVRLMNPRSEEIDATGAPRLRTRW